MHKIALAALAAAVITGCASAPPEPSVNSYTYESKAHSGTVIVTDKQYDSEAINCEAEWREAEVYTPKGLVPMGRDHLSFSLDLQAESKPDQKIDLSVPMEIGSRVLAKDYQKLESYMLGVETNGIVQQGNLFSFPSGYYVRVSKPSIKGWQYQACIGIDHMYVLDADLQTSNSPPVYLDRVVVPFAMEESGQPVKVSFGNKLQHTAEIRVQTK